MRKCLGFTISNILIILNSLRVISNNHQASGFANNIDLATGAGSEATNGTIQLSKARFSRTVASQESIRRPDSRMSGNRTAARKSALSQLHVFFEDRAREDAYQKTEAKEHPYSLALRCNLRGYGADMCSGTLVTPRWALTAAHCVVDDDVISVEVFAGVTFNIFGERAPDPLPSGAQARTSREFYAHPRYDPTPSHADYDLALVKIAPPFETTEFVRPAGVVTASWRPGGGPRDCLLTAFGMVRTGRESADDFIRKTQRLRVEKPCRCDATLRREMGPGPTSRYVCTKPMPDFGICSGDSGGGLVCDGEVAAVVSQSIVVPNMAARCKRGSEGLECGDADGLSVFQEVYPSLAWIQETASLDAPDDEDSSGASQRLDFHFGLCVFLLCLSVGLMRYT